MMELNKHSISHDFETIQVENIALNICSQIKNASDNFEQRAT